MKTDITVLLDRSASMASIKGAMETAFTSFVKGHQAVPSTRLTLVEFDSVDKTTDVKNYIFYGRGLAETKIETRYTALPISNVPPLDLQPRGSTPLIDAICLVVDSTGQRLAAIPEDQRPAGVLFVVITDGEENCSAQFTREQARDRITHQTETYNWQFVYLGANQDALAEAQSYGITAQNAMTFAASGAGVTSGSASLTTNTVAYATNTSASNWAAAIKSLEFDNKQRAEALKGK